VELDGKVALVTGGASGIGQATVERLSQEGMSVCVVDRAEDAGRAVADAVGGTFVTADAGDSAQVDAAFAHCIDRLGAVDVAFLNAGIAIGHADLATLTDDVYRLIMRVNVDGVVFGARAAIRAMSGRGGAIVATASLAGLTGVPLDPLYAANKHAVVGLVRSLGPTLSAEGIRINAVCPGFAESGMIAPFREALIQDGVAIIPAEDVASVVVGLFAGDMAGECWFVQPGRTGAFAFRHVPGPRLEPAA